MTTPFQAILRNKLTLELQKAYLCMIVATAGAGQEFD